MKISIYKEIDPDGDMGFVVAVFDGEFMGVCNSIEILVKKTRSYITYCFKEKLCNQVSIDFSPPQDILCFPPIKPFRCKKLSEEEENEFWKYFSEIDKEVRDG